MGSWIEWIGFATGSAGALLLALRVRCSGWGFVLFLVSNGCWIAYGASAGALGLVLMQIIMTGTSLVGIYRWIWQGRDFRARKSESGGQSDAL